MNGSRTQTPEDALAKVPERVRELLITGAGNPLCAQKAAIALCRGATKRAFLNNRDLPNAAAKLLRGLSEVAQTTSFDPVEVMKWGLAAIASIAILAPNRVRDSVRRRIDEIFEEKHGGRRTDSKWDETLLIAFAKRPR